ncbi:MAG: TldD/PmbA family protein [Lachnospiraceae bacterium]|nr:TldD/PmbA family protein [Lachnospiraceae bacterium]
MEARFSDYLSGIKSSLKKLIKLLSEDFDYVSVLATDSVGIRVIISQNSKSVSDSNMTTERGVCVRVRRDGLYSECAFNFSPEEDTEALYAGIKQELDAQLELIKLTGTPVYETDILPDEALNLFVEMEAEKLPEYADMDELIEFMTGISNRGMEIIPKVLDTQVSANSTHISKLFMTKNRDLSQSYVYTEGTVVAYAPNDKGEIKLYYGGVSGNGGLEILDGLTGKLEEAPKTMEELLAAGKVVPGEYDIITSPEVTGLIAHEAFGHGVEMDMFVKGRALGAEYIGKRVGSDLVTMHEGALTDESVTSYAFDDEGTLAGDVTEIDKGILKTGICDALSALRLGTVPTGNGKRENYAHKVYTRMTNTVFDSGEDTLEDMIASIKHGYLLKGMESGMEDPKHWGIQCIISRGYEIKDGKLTGNVVSPVIMTGYVPDLLGAVSMATPDRCIYGNGGCGKGHKEWVKVADGGPYLKTKARLG